MRTDRARIAPLGRGRMLPADPREALLAMAAERNETLTALSRLIGRSAGYLSGYVKRQSPAALPDADRRLLGKYLGIDDSLLA
jgi:hypothetical protein